MDMNDMNLPVIAGATSTVMFGVSMLPMLRKAYQTKDLRSYSLENILLSSAGSVIHSIHVYHLPPGPIWLLHSFYLVSTGLMLRWYLRYEWRPDFASRLSVRWRTLGGTMTSRFRSLHHEPPGPLPPRQGPAVELVASGQGNRS